MYLNSILSIVAALDGTALIPPCPFEEMPFWVKESSRHLFRVPVVKEEGGWVIASDEDVPTIATIREMDRRLRAVYWWARSMGEAPPARTLLGKNTRARVQDLERTLYYPNHNSGEVCKFFGLQKRIVDNGHYLMEQWFDVKLLRLFTHSHHVTWWVKTPFGATVWPTLEEIVELWHTLNPVMRPPRKPYRRLPKKT